MTLLSANGGDGSEGFVLNGIDKGDFSGRSVSAAGDVNGDGIGDLIVGAYHGGTAYAGESYVVFGRDTSPFPAELELSTLLSASGGDGSKGFVLNGIDAGDNSGRAVSAAGDVNGDGFDDLIVGADGAEAEASRYSAGETYVVFGRGDTDGDGVHDAADNCAMTGNPDQADSDSDAVGDACDNCTEKPNPTQCDTNNDGFGNHCDADLDNNNIVNQIDLGIMRSQFGTMGASDADLDCNNVVNQSDLGRMRDLFGQPPGPGAP